MHHTILKTILLLVCICFSYTSDAAEITSGPKRITGIWWVPYSIGYFSPFGNGGSVTFPDMTDGVYLLPWDNTLQWYVFVETVGWVEFGVAGYPVNLTPPSGANASILEAWTTSGNVWSDNIGWITLDSLDPSAYSWVSYLPASQSFTGYAWSDQIGYIDFGTTDGLSRGFIGKVKVIGNIAGKKSFDVLYHIGNTFNFSGMTSFLNMVKKNIALMTRSLPADKINTNPSTMLPSIVTTNNTVFYKVSSAGNPYVSMGTGSNNILSYTHAASIIVEWADVYIDGDITPDASHNLPRAIIVVKWANGKWGNVYIHSSVKSISSSIITEGSLYSGKRNATDTGWDLYNDTKFEVTNIPPTQLYVLGSIISRNTIGGSARNEWPICPYTIDVCDRDNAIPYDMNYFRWYDKSDANRAYKNNSLDEYSFIIEYDGRLLLTPPPGLRGIVE